MYISLSRYFCLKVNLIFKPKNLNYWTFFISTNSIKMGCCIRDWAITCRQIIIKKDITYIDKIKLIAGAACIYSTVECKAEISSIIIEEIDWCQIVINKIIKKLNTIKVESKHSHFHFWQKSKLNSNDKKSW